MDPRLRFSLVSVILGFGKGSDCIRYVPRIHFRACEHNCDLGLRRLNRQIPHTD